jgi:sodium/proline symporter
MTSSETGILISIAIYMVAMLGIGIYFAKKNENVGDYYLGGRKLGPFVTAMSAEASDMSSWLLMGLPGVAYLSGVADAAWTAIGLAIGTYINWLIVAKRIRTYSNHIDAITIPEFFSKRYHDDRNILSGIAAFIIIVFFVPYTASGFAACGKLFSSIFGISYFWAMIISAAVIIGYTSLGGFMAASTTDLIQSIVMTIALVVILTYGIYMAGGWDMVVANSKALPGYISFGHTYDPVSGSSSKYGVITIISTMAWGLGYFGMPHILLRFMAIEDRRKLTLSRRVATVWVVISLGVAILIGIVGYSISKAGNLAVLTGSQSETIIVRVAGLLSTHGFAAAIIAGVVLAGILAATMSTSDSQLLAASSSFSQNIIREFLHINISEKTAMRLAKITVLTIAAISIVVASNPNSSVFQIVSFAWAGFGATFGPVMLLALFWKHSSKNGAISGMAVGAVMIFIWKYAIRPLGGGWDIYELLPAFLIALAVNVIVSLASKPDAAVEAEYDGYVEALK